MSSADPTVYAREQVELVANFVRANWEDLDWSRIEDRTAEILARAEGVLREHYAEQL